MKNKSQMKKSVTSNASTCHSYLIKGEKSSSEANKRTVWCANFTMNLDTILLTAVWIGLSIHCVPPCRFFFFLVIIPVAAASVAFPVKCWFTVSCTGTYVFLFSEDVSAWVPNKAINISQYRFDLWEKEVFDHFPGKQGTPMTRVCFSRWIAGLVGDRGKTRSGS